MTKAIKKNLDLIPLVILLVSAGYLLWVYFDGQIIFIWKHIAGFILLAITTLLFFKKRKPGVLLLGLTILLGLFGLLSFSPAISIISFGKGQTIFLQLQPIFILPAVLHFVLSRRYYLGILSKTYWENINSDETFRIE